jgi:transposase
VQVDQIAQWFRRSKQVVKRAIKSLSGDSREDADSRKIAIKSRGIKFQVIQIIRKVIESKRDLVTTRLLRNKIKEGMDFDISAHRLRMLLTTDLALTWTKVSNQNQYVNKPRNILLQQVFSQQLISLLKQGKVILKFDESCYSGSSFRSYSWQPKSCRTGRQYRSEFTGLTLMLAVASSGLILFQFLQGHNNECSVAAFIIQLVRHLDREAP